MPELFRVREARVDELSLTERIEEDADALLIANLGAVDWPPSTTAAERAAHPGFVLVVENAIQDAAHDTHDDEAIDRSSLPRARNASSIVGFVHVLEIDGHAHLEQLSVLPEHGGAGRGRLLVEAAKEEARRRGHGEMTLRTYRDVPWNAPFYERCGFSESTPDTEFLRGLVDIERALGLDRYGARLQMSISL